MGELTKTLVVGLRFKEGRRMLKFKMRVPVNVFAIDASPFDFKPAAGSGERSMTVQVVRFVPATDGTVDFLAIGGDSHNYERSYDFLQTHPDVTDLIETSW